MGIENELMEFLDSNIRDGANKARDIEIIKFYYGLNESPWPTLDETASRFNVGSRERIRQLLNSKFRIKANNSSIPSLIDLIRLLQSREYWLVQEFEEEAYAARLIERESHIKGIFNLIDDINIDCEFEFYTPELKQVTRKSIAISNNIFLIKKNHIKNVTKAFRKAQVLPGRCGVGNLKYINEEIGQYYSIVSQLIENAPNSWVRVIEDNYWYIFENRENTIINYIEKVFGVIEHSDPARLANVIRNALDGRTYNYPYPPEEIIEDYLRSSVFLVNTDLGLKFIGETTKLNEIEEDLVSFFNSNENASFHVLYEYLSKKNYQRPHILKTTNFSPLVYVDKSKGRRHYVYSLVERWPTRNDDSLDTDRYESYLRRLRALLATGTDVAKEQTARREHHILQDWLFKDKIHENCAICGQEFSVKTLVTAHKKPRSECNDAERLDPNIVMPVCLMGCDYLYENMYIYIEGDEVKRGLPFANIRGESSFIENLIGRKVDFKWLRGNKSYFRSPYRDFQRTSCRVQGLASRID